MISLCCTTIYAAPVPHTHGGRTHSHPLPKEGIKHRHGGGAIGLAVPGGDVASASSIKSWLTPDGKHAVLSIPNENRAYYFNNNNDRLCFSFSVPGKWQPTKEAGLLSSGDLKKFAGVVVLSVGDLTKYQGKDLLSRAVSLHLKSQEKLHGKPAHSSKVESFKSNYSGSKKWIGEWYFTQRGRTYLARMVRYLAEVKPGWVAVVTGWRDMARASSITHKTNDDSARVILQSISITDDPDCYRLKIRELMKKK